MMRLPSKVAELKGLATNALTKRRVSKNRHNVRGFSKNSPPSMKEEFSAPEKSVGYAGLFIKLFGVALVGVGGATAYCIYDESTRKLVKDNVPYSSCYFAIIDKLLKSDSKTIKADLPVSKPPKVIEKYISIQESTKLDSSTNSLPQIVEPKIDIPIPIAEEIVEPELMEAMKVILGNIEIDIKETLSNLHLSLEKIKNASSETLNKKFDQMTEMDYLHTNKAIDASNALADLAKKQLEQLNKAISDAIPSLTESTLNDYLSSHSNTVKEVEAIILEINKVKINKVKIENKEFKTPEDKTPVPQEEVNNTKIEDFLEYVDIIEETTSTTSPVVTPEADILTSDIYQDVIDAACDDCNPLMSTSTIDETEALRRSLDEMKQQYEAEITIRLEEERTRLFDSYTSSLARKDKEYKLELEEEIQKNNVRMTLSHHDHLNLKLTQKDEEFVGKHAEIVKEAKREAKTDMRLSLATWISRMEGIEEGLKSRADAEYKAKKSQELWLACQALLTSVEIGIVNENCDIGVPKPLESEVKAVLNAGDGHPLVSEVTGQFGVTALTDGVSSTAELNDRFKKVYQQSRRLALVDEANCSLLRHALSYLQSAVVFRRPLEANENANDLDTFQIVDSAAQSMDNGDLLQALKFMNQLKGSPREIAKDWISDVRVHLETKMAVEALITYARASGISALF